MGCRRKRVGQWNEIFYSLRLLAAAKEKIHPARRAWSARRTRIARRARSPWRTRIARMALITRRASMASSHWLGELGELGELGGLGGLGDLG